MKKTVEIKGEDSNIENGGRDLTKKQAILCIILGGIKNFIWSWICISFRVLIIGAIVYFVVFRMGVKMMSFLMERYGDLIGVTILVFILAGIGSGSAAIITIIVNIWRYVESKNAKSGGAGENAENE